MNDDLLGQQQDDLARLRYELAKTIEGAPDFQDCKISGLDVYRRALELGQEAALREELTRSFQGIRSDFNAEPWLDRLVQAIRNNDQTSFDQFHQRAIIAAMFPGPSK